MSSLALIGAAAATVAQFDPGDGAPGRLRPASASESLQAGMPDVNQQEPEGVDGWKARVIVVEPRVGFPTGDSEEGTARRIAANSGERSVPPQPDAARQGWGEAERLLRAVGIDIERFLDRFALPARQGGPFVAVDPRKRRLGGEVGPDEIQTALRSLPLVAPLEAYQLESRFGMRIDPLNRQKSFHTGLDFSAPFRSPVYNTAPGIVIHAGGKGDYGRVVEIDHGSGIVTRYAHLHRVLVAVGQKLVGRQQIGMLGSTGRSSGPHVHYEILVNGTPLDPERFLKLGRTTLISTQ
jgi:murein DD-endopeptidase MepM/ murein hydrolase activator NlpD